MGVYAVRCYYGVIRANVLTKNGYRHLSITSIVVFNKYAICSISRAVVIVNGVVRIYNCDGVHYWFICEC